MSFFIDRRSNSKNKSAVNRQRFIHRYRSQIKDAVEKSIAERSITNTDGGEKVGIPARDTREPIFQHGKGGRYKSILPGNREFTQGDRIKRPEGGGSGGGAGEASNQGEGMDNFVFELSRDEFLDFLFEDMALPNLSKRILTGSDEIKKIRAGFSAEGTPSNINIIRSMRSAIARRIALGAAKRRELRELETHLEEYTDKTSPLYMEVQAKIDDLRRQLARIPFLDDIDIRYHRHDEQIVPHSKAVMFCLMDVSGSMDQYTKDLAKRFFILLYLFLERNYEKTDVVFIRHHTRAEEVDEERFFYSRETGGTVVSSALELMNDIISARYPISEWNIYCSQASDGDNWPEDDARCLTLLRRILPSLQYYAYIEITDKGPKSLWRTYQTIQEQFPEVFAMQNIKGPADIYPVFHELFSKVNV